ncbi:MAG: Uncharacterized protein FD156_1852 [Nitrospirae bacterium]|nr:MAG: Uncharacterized protein FD156_1852 [Nitrospirota bacterium]
MTKVYIETSAANYFLNNLNGEGAEATRRLQLSKGRHWFISTTVLWEVLQIVERRDLDACLFLGSYLFHDRLLKSAAEIGIDYIERGMPDYLVLDSPFTDSTLGLSWQRACKDKSYSFFVDDKAFTEVTSELKRISRHIRYLAGERENYKPTLDDSIRGLASFLDEIYDKYFSDNVPPLTNWLRKIALLVVFLQLCLSLDITRDVVEQYWRKTTIEDPFERLTYLMEKYAAIVRQGPFWNIANAIFIQSARSGLSSRGAFHDGLHAIYLPFVDIFFTNDDHFRSLRDKSYKEFRELLYDKIFHLDEVELLRVEHKLI